MRAGLLMTPFLLLAGCNLAGGHSREDSGNHQFEKRAVQVAGAFDSISLGGSQNVVVTVGGPPSVRVEGEADLLDRLDIAVRGSDLHIGYKRDRGWSWGFSHDRKPVTVYVSVPSLKGASIGGSGDIRIDKVEGGDFTGSIGGSGDLQIGALKVGRAGFSIAGSGDIRAAGSAESTDMSIAGSGGIDAGGLQAQTAKVSVMGSGSVSARASESADVSVMGSGDVEVVGGAKCAIHKMGSGDVRCS
jgi:Putative auto-transporter adhesin, head GIN domain